MTENNSNLLPTLHSGDIDLRPWRVEDAAWYVDSRDEETFRWTTEKRDLTVADTEAAIRRVYAPGSDLVCYAIVDHQTGRLLGNLALWRKEGDPDLASDPLAAGTGEVSYWLAPEARGRGAATRAVRCLCDYAFQVLGLQRVRLKTLPGNAASQAVALRSGFIRLESESAGAVWFERVREP